MFTFSSFVHTPQEGVRPFEVPVSADYKVYVNGTEVPVYTCRISAYPFNGHWPGHQRPLEQSELVSYVNLVSDEAIEIAVEPLTKTAYEKIMLKPYRKQVATQVRDGKIVFTLQENGGYVLELDDYHGLLYVFNNKPCPCEGEVTHYFGPGVHFTGKLTLRSNESVYVHKDALVYGCIYAENAENIRIYGNGIFNDSTEERVGSHCYANYTNGNIKFYDCKNITVQGVGFTNSAIWCVNLFHCFDVVLDGIRVFGQWRYNTDGVDVVNSKRVTIRNSFVHSFDDTITIKGLDRYAFENNEDILVEDCVLWCDWGMNLEIGLETACAEYKNIIFRRCDLLRGGHVACDIQNGDNALVHGVLFEDITLELEPFYTASQLQKNDTEKYNQQDTLEIANLLAIRNNRFRTEFYAFLNLPMGDTSKLGTADYAAVRDVTLRNVQIYCHEKILSEWGNKCASVLVKNTIPTTQYSNITVENVMINGKKLEKDDMNIRLIGVDETVLTVK